MVQSEKCWSSQSAPEKTFGISTSGIGIMGSMNAETSCSLAELNGLSAYEKPGYKGYKRHKGYKLCKYVESFIETGEVSVPIIKIKLGKEDYFSSFLVRCGIGRSSYTVSPGLYAIGKPDKNSEVLVTANFKLTFDHLRKELAGISVWILVLDTKGINVWCAAGKGTFSTSELVQKIKSVSLASIVDHRRIIVPQLGATGVSARQVKVLSGFRVIFGPIRAKDIPTFLKNNKTVDKDMRMVTFSLYERFILTPVELQLALKPFFITALILFIVSGAGSGFFSFSGAITRGVPAVYALITGIISGAFITPILLPYIPSRIFALKGSITGSVCAALFIFFCNTYLLGYLFQDFCVVCAALFIFFCNTSVVSFSGLLALFIFIVTVSSYMAMNFTGSTPFTSPSGVEKEMKLFIPFQLFGLVLALGLWIFSAF